MRRYFVFLFLIPCGLNFVFCNKTDNSVVVGMKNDSTKSVKKVLESYIPPSSNNLTNVKESNSSGVVLKQGSTILNNTYNVLNDSKSNGVATEGGIINLTPIIHTSVKLNSTLNSTVSPLNSTSTRNLTLPQRINSVPFEGGGTAHMGEGNNTTVKPKIVTDKMPSSILSPTVKKVNEERKISARKGVSFDFPLNTTISSSTVLTPTIKLKTSSTTSVYSTESTTRRHKPKFTMIVGDHESKERKSFIESPTTGKDYIFPIVLTIMALPLVFLIIKLIYKRGSEYTERRHYDRMYLIDGMYNTR